MRDKSYSLPPVHTYADALRKTFGGDRQAATTVHVPSGEAPSGLFPDMEESEPVDVMTSLEKNGICPYFTMFPLDFPLRILGKRASTGDSVLDPFCGRGTTNFASGLLGLPSLGVDSNPVAAAITASKLVNTNVRDILREPVRSSTGHQQ